nr:PREDICTED: DNA-dependent protein kinase catalytic subunit-like [Bemisia tabaci]
MAEIDEILQDLSHIPSEPDAQAAENYKQRLIALFSHFKAQVDNLDYDLSALFNEETGIITLLHKLLRKTKYKSCVSYTLSEISETILKDHKNRVLQHVEKIAGFCVKCAQEDSQSSDSKEAALKILIEFISHNPSVHSLDGRQFSPFITKLLAMKTKFSNTVMKQVYILLGHLGNSYFEVFNSNPERFFNAFVCEIEESKRKLDSDTAGVSAVLEGCFYGLVEYMKQFEIPPQSKSYGEKLYKLAKTICIFDANRNRKTYQRAALKMMEIHSGLFKNFLVSDYKWWHTNLRKWLTNNTNKDNQTAVIETLKSVCRVIAKEIVDKETDQGRQILEYFSKEITNWSNTSCIFQSADLSLDLLIIFVEPYKKYSGDDLSNLFSDIVKRAECLCAEKNESDTAAEFVMARIGEFLNCLATLVCNDKDITHQQLVSLETLTIMVMKMYPDCGRNWKASQTIERTVLCLSLKSEKTLDTYLGVIVFQGIIRTCDTLILQDVEFHKSENMEVTSYKDYLPMWESLLRLSKRHSIEPTIPECEAARIRKLLYRHLIDSALLVIDRLDLSTVRKEDDENQPVINDIKSKYDVRRPKDFTMLVNLMDLLKDLCPKLDKYLFLEHLPRFGRSIIDFSVRFPLVSSFYKIIATALQIADEKGYFKTETTSTTIEAENFRLLVQSYLELVLNRALQFTDELQIACLHVIMAAPTTFIDPILPLISSFLKVAFRVGSSYLPLADLALTTLERWIDAFPPEKINPFLKEILPCLDSFLRSKDFEGDPEAANGLDAEFKVLTSALRKSKRKIKKIHERQDTELFRIQKRIILMLSKIDISTALTILSEDSTRSKWKSTKQLKFTIPFPDCRLNLYLDEMLPRIVESALSSSNRKTKVAASELLHAVVLVLLGNDKQMANLESNQTADVLKELMPALLQLGSDSDEVVRTLFQHLVRPMMFYFSSKFQAHTNSVKVVFEALMDGITNPTDSAVRDFTAECIKGFTQGAIKQSKSSNEKVPLYIKGIISRINLYCVHPCKFKRLGGAMIFNSIHSCLREEKPIINEHWLELMYYLVKNLSLSEENNDCSDQLRSALRHILRVFEKEEFRKMLNSRNPNRKKPIEFEDETLQGATLWLLKQTSSPSIVCRTETMVLFQRFASFLPGFISASNYLNSLISTEGEDFVSNLVEENLTVEPLRDRISPYVKVISWLKNLHAALEFYSWLIGGIIIDPGLLLKADSRFMQALKYFISNVGATSCQHFIEILYSDWSAEVPQLDSNLYSSVATEVLAQLFKFLTISHNSLKEEFFCEILKEPLWKLIVLCTLRPSTTVARGVCSETSLKFSEVVAELLRSLDKYLTQKLQAELHDAFSTEVSVVYENLINKPLMYQLLHQASNNEVAEGLVLLQQIQSCRSKNSFLMKVLKDKSFSTVNLYQKIFNSLYDSNGTTVHLSEKDTDFLRSLFSLATLLDEEVELLSGFIFKTDQARLKDSLRPVTQGDHFKYLFFRQIISRFSDSFSKAVHHLITPDKIHADILLAIMKEHECSPPNINQRNSELVKCIFQKWDIIQIYGNKYDNSYARMSTVLDILMALVKTFKNRVGCFRSPEAVGIIKWLMEQLGKDIDVNLKFSILDFLVALFNPGSQRDATYDNVIEPAIHAYTAALETHILGESSFDKNYILVKTSLNKLLAGLELTGNAFLLKRIMIRTSTDLNQNIRNDIKKTLANLTKKKNDIIKKDLLNVMFDCAVGLPELENYRENILKTYLEPTLRYCCIKSGKNVLKVFYEGCIENLMTTVNAEFTLSAKENEINTEIVSKIVALTLLEILFGYFDRSDFDTEWFKTASKVSSGQEFLQKLLKVFVEPKNCTSNFKSADYEDALRRYHCASFNATMALICNSKRDVPSESSKDSDPSTSSVAKKRKSALDFYTKFVFSKLGTTGFMDKIINLKQNYRFHVDFNSDELPKQKKTLVSIRRAARSETGRAPIQGSMDISTQSLFAGSLSEDLTSYDLSNHRVVEVEAVQEAQVAAGSDINESACLELEMDVINEHECMPMLTAVINTMKDAQLIQPPPEIIGSSDLPNWIKPIHQALINQNVHKNIKIFLCKLILNVSEVFAPYASHFILSISEAIAAKCFGSEINYFVADLVTLMLSWRKIAVPDGKKDENRTTVSELLSFLMANTESFNKRVFRRNLEIVKTVVEVWKSSLDIPYQLLLDLLKPEDNDPKSEKAQTGIMLAGILVVNNIAPYASASKMKYLSALVRKMHSQKTTIYEPTAEVIGRILLFLQQEGSDYQLTNDGSTLLNSVKTLMQRIYKPTEPKFYRCLLKISLSFPPVVKEFLRQMIVNFTGTKNNNLQEKCLDLLQLSIDSTGSDLCELLQEVQIIDLWMNYLSTSGSQCHLAALKLFAKLLLNNLLPTDLQKKVIAVFLNLVSSSKRDESRKIIFETVSILYSRYCNNPAIEDNIKNRCKEILIRGLVDRNAEIQKSLYEFWMKDNVLPEKSIDRLRFVISNMYIRDIEYAFLGYCLRFVLDCAEQTLSCRENIFDFPLANCNLFELPINAAWKRQHASFVPLFADTTQRSSQSSSFSDSAQVRATQSLEFAPTVASDAVSDNFDHPQVTSSLNDSGVPSSFDFVNTSKFKSRSFMRKFEKPHQSTDIANVGHVISSQHKSYRLKKTQSKEDDSKYALQNIKLNKAIEIAQREEVEKRSKEVTVLRTYKTGDFPDIEISYKELIVPLRVFVQQDQSSARHLTVALFKSFLDEESLQGADDFYREVMASIGNILQNSLSFNPAIIGAFFEVSYFCHEKINLDFDAVSTAAQASGLLSLGTVVLENQISALSESDFSSGPSAKRQRLDRMDETNLTEEANIWFKLAELYYSLSESDVVLGIFRDKLTNGNVDLIKATEKEQLEDWQGARRHYFEVYKDETYSEKQRQFVTQSYFKCTALCSNWNELKQSVLVALDSDYDRLWEEDKKLWNLENIAPWLFSSELHMFIRSGNSEFPQKINQWIHDKDKERRKENELLNYVGEQLAVWNAIEVDSFERGKLYAKGHLSNLLNDWAHLNPLSHQLRTKKLLDFQLLSDILNMLFATDSFALTQMTKMERLLKDWNKHSPAISDSLTHWDTRLLYRCLFLNQVWKELGNDLETGLCKSLKDSRLHLIDITLKGKNSEFAKQQLRLVKQHIPESVNTLYTGKYHLKCAQFAENENEKAKKINQSWNALDSMRKMAIEDDLQCMRFSLMADVISSFRRIMPKISADNRNSFEKKVRSELVSHELLFSTPLEENLRKLGFLCLKEALEWAGRTESVNQETVLADAHMKIVRYCFGVYNQQEEAPEEYNQYFIRSLLSAMEYNSEEATQLFPCLLQLECLEISEMSELFKNQCKRIPEWKFLEWVPQLLTALYSPKVAAVSDLLLRLAEKYPNALIYPFRLSKEMQAKVSSSTQTIVDSLGTLLDCDYGTEKFLKAMACLCLPDVKLKSFLGRLKTSLEANDGKCAVCIGAVLEIFDEAEIKGNIYSLIGDLKKDVIELKKYVDKGKLKEALKQTENIMRAITPCYHKQPSRDARISLKSYSPWLASFISTAYSSTIEMPGQYSGKMRPDLKNHIMIAGFKTEVSVMQSLRRPIKLTMIGNDGNEYSFLVKCGEDLRQDQRIQQLLTLMNSSLTSNSGTAARKLSIVTYAVVPLSSSLGLIQWVNDTVPLKELMFKFFLESDTEKYKKQVAEHYSTWLSKCCRTNPTAGRIYGSAAQTYSRQVVINTYNEHVSKLEKINLRKSFMSNSLNLEAFISMRNEFLCSYAVMSICHWILGIGDRHLSNTLVNLFTGKCLGIDFGHAFGSATQILPVPELIPFRLTPHILDLAEPFKEFGLLRESMVSALKCQKDNQHVLLATMQVFIQEPSMDWFENAHRLAQKQSGESDGSKSRSNYFKDAQDSFSLRNIELAWKKLEGGHPTEIMIKELEAGHKTSPYLDAFKKILQGTNESLRFKFRIDQELNANQQVDILLDQAKDKHILGITYAGWEPWA